MFTVAFSPKTKQQITKLEESNYYRYIIHIKFSVV